MTHMKLTASASHSVDSTFAGLITSKLNSGVAATVFAQQQTFTAKLAG
jgi:hypothetical protein